MPFPLIIAADLGIESFVPSNRPKFLSKTNFLDELWGLFVICPFLHCGWDGDADAILEVEGAADVAMWVLVSRKGKQEEREQR